MTISILSIIKASLKNQLFYSSFLVVALSTAPPSIFPIVFAPVSYPKFRVEILNPKNSSPNLITRISESNILFSCVTVLKRTVPIRTIVSFGKNSWN